MPKEQALPITEAEAFEEWVRLKRRDLRTLQRLLEHRHDTKIPMNVITRWCTLGQWVERAFQVDLMADAEINAAAFESVQGRMVRRRAESMEHLGSSWDELAVAQCNMVKSDAFKAHHTLGASPDVLLKILMAMEKIGKLYQGMMPVSRPVPAAHADEGVSPDQPNADELLVGAIDPLAIANRLVAVAKKRPLIEIKASGNAAT